MTPVTFPQANTTFHKPADLTDEQCGSAEAFQGEIASGSLEGAPVIVTAWKPDPMELEALRNGGSVFITFITEVLPPHTLATNFESAINPQ